MSAPSSGWRWIATQSSSVSVRPRSATRSDSAKCPMSCSRPAVWASSHSASLIPTASRDVPREPRHRGRVAGGALVADVQRAHQTGQHAPGQRDVLLGPPPRPLDQLRHVGEREDGDQRERDPGQPQLEVDAGAGDRDRHVQRLARGHLPERLEGQRSLVRRSPAGTPRRSRSSGPGISAPGEPPRRRRSRPCATARGARTQDQLRRRPGPTAWPRTGCSRTRTRRVIRERAVAATSAITASAHADVGPEERRGEQDHDERGRDAAAAAEVHDHRPGRDRRDSRARCSGSCGQRGRRAGLQRPRRSDAQRDTDHQNAVAARTQPAPAGRLLRARIEPSDKGTPMAMRLPTSSATSVDCARSCAPPLLRTVPSPNCVG